MAKVNQRLCLVNCSLFQSPTDMQGSANEFAIVVDDTGSVSSLSDFDINEDKPTRVKGSPLKKYFQLVNTGKYKVWCMPAWAKY